MSNLARQEMYFQHFFTLDELVKSMESVDAAAVQRIALTFFEPKQIAFAILGILSGFRIGRDALACQVLVRLEYRVSCLSAILALI